MLKRLRNIVRVLSNITEDDLRRLGVEVENKKKPVQILKQEHKEEKRLKAYIEKNKFNTINTDDFYGED